MKCGKKILLSFLAFMMVSMQLITPLAVNASDDVQFDDAFESELADGDHDMTQSEDFENDDFDEDHHSEEILDADEQGSNDTDFNGNDELNQFEEEGLEEDLLVDVYCPIEPLGSSADLDDVPEMLFADQILEYIPEPEECIGIQPFSATPGGAGSGLVQFVLEPVQSSLPSGVTMAQARTAAMNSQAVYHQLHLTATTNEVATGVNGAFGRDAIFLGQSADGNRFQIMIAGFVGFVSRVGRLVSITVPINGVNRTFDVRANAEFVPFGNYPTAGSGNVMSMSHYINRNGELWRRLTTNVNNTQFQEFLAGPAPSWMSQGTRYYSYDGVYFYRNPRNIRENGSGAVNANNPHFNYFQYLSFRTTSTVTASQLNNFLTNQSFHGINTSNSVLINQGNAFINAQDRYGINALLMYAKAMLESAGGTSAIARNNNNVFGQGAIDAAPGQNAWVFASVAASVNDLANGWLSRGYLWPGNPHHVDNPTLTWSENNTLRNGDWRNEGPHSGHKGSGMNVRYAMDPYWGEKIAGWAFRIDRTRAASSRDLNREQIAIRRNTSTVTVTTSGGEALYIANRRGARYFPFLVTGTSGDRLRILTDATIVNNRTNRTTRFNRNNAVGFIPNTNVWRVGASTPRPTPPAGDTNNNNNQSTTTFSRLRTGVTVNDVNFRTGPGNNHSIAQVVSANTNVRITGVQGSWYRVRHNNTTGWMHRDHVQETRQRAVVRRNNIPIRATRSSNARVLTRVNSGERLVVERRSPNWSRVTVNGHTGWIRNNEITMNNAGRPGIVTANVNVHITADANSSVIRRLPRNAQVIQLQRTTNGSGANQGWTQVRIRHANGTLTGWVRTNHVENRVHSRRIIGSGTAILRSGPGTGFSINRRINTNTEVTVLMQTQNWSRVRVRVNGRNEYGWIANSRISRLSLPAQP